MDVQDAPNPVPDGKRLCFCCNKWYDTRTLARHLKIFLERFNQHLLRAGLAEDAEALEQEALAGVDGLAGHAAMELDENMDKDAVEAPVMVHQDDDLGPEDLDIAAAGPHGGEPPPHAQPRQAHEPAFNPPVEIDNWPDPPSDISSEGSVEELADDLDGDPEFDEPPVDPANFGLDPLYEPNLTDGQARALLEEHIGDMDDEEWLNLYDRTLLTNDRTTLQFLATRLRTHFSRQTYNELRYGPCKMLDIPSEFIAYRRLAILAGFGTRAYDCCVNSCCCFLGKHKDLDACPYCAEPRFSVAGRPRRSFHYTPLIPQLQALFRSRQVLAKLMYRSKVEGNSEPDMIEDVYDGEHYRKLRNTQLDPDTEYRILDNPEDLVLGLSTDGFTLFKRRRRGLSTAWPLIFINYNLHPKYRVRLENIICVGVIPGPRQCKDLNSFLVPVLEELLRLEQGVDSIKTTPATTPEHEEHPENEGDGELTEFKLRAFLIMIFGDIPAVSKLLAMKGHNAMVPCRTCYTQGVLCRREKNSVYYVPLTLPGNEDGYPPDMLLLRTHELFLHHYESLDNLDDRPGRRKQLAKELGINDRPIFARFKSFDLACCAPYDIMHLLFENLVPNMIKHWIGKFKKLDQGTGHYQLAEAVWKQIGKETAKATCTIPVSFVGTLPDIAEDQTLYKAEAYSFWIQYIAPIVLAGRLPEPYFEHFLLMRDIIIMSIQLDITKEQIDELQNMVNRWVVEYERYYYQHDYHRLPTCPLTIHALLHMPYYIRKTGPLWASWAFVMERFCGHLLPAVKNRFQPYRHLDNAVLRRAQMQVVAHTYGLPTLPRSTVKWRIDGSERLSSRECRYLQFPKIILGIPVKKAPPIDIQLTNQLTKFLGPIYRPHGLTTGAQLRARIDWQTIVSYGRFRMADDGDRIRTASSVQRTHDSTGSSRDNSFVRFTVLPDANASNNGSDDPYEEVNYGQLIGIYYLEFITDFESNERDCYLVARIRLCKETGSLDAALPENPKVTYRTLSTPDIFHLMTIDAVVGRIQVETGEWAIIDCSRNGARTQFTNDDDDDAYD
ncbi:Transposase family Tnp2 protein [Ceratobasidium sp. AG-Ba]|nr:Transposase family Tnp2 protein [Ceratobasidium sp. AG-Ba]QRW06034.1 Transposase family Tnp2 protein [Ceratobasidium sp. AG-Ba]